MGRTGTRRTVYWSIWAHDAREVQEVVFAKGRNVLHPRRLVKSMTNLAVVANEICWKIGFSNA
jgi:hypothetical protein